MVVTVSRPFVHSGILRQIEDRLSDIWRDFVISVLVEIVPFFLRI